MVKVSVIIPAYNVEGYISRCIDSVKNQSYSDLEIIIINDGSTDKTGDVINELAKFDDRIIILHQENKGVLEARKAGIIRATGEYCFFVDSDDWIDSDMVSVLVGKAIENKSDIVFSGLVRVNDDVQSVKKDVENEITYTGGSLKAFYKYIFDDEKDNNTGVFLSVCSKCIRTSLLKQISCSELRNMSFLEDTAMLLACCFLADSITIIPQALYYYYMRNDSTTHRKNDNILSDINKMYVYVKECATKSTYYDIIRDGLDVFFVDQCIRGLSIYYDLSDSAKFPYYLFPMRIPEGSKVIIYGAGRVGESFYLQFSNMEGIKVVAWVDKNVADCRGGIGKVCVVDNVLKYEYDILIIAVRYEEMAMQIKQNLINYYGMQENKIVWVKPAGILDEYIRKSR